jgi:hypothetical protein
MHFLDELSRGLFIASLLGLSTLTCYGAVVVQRHYVSAVSKSILSSSVAISRPFFVFSRTRTVEPRTVKLSHVSIRDLLGRPHSPAELEARANVPLTDLAVFTIEVEGQRMLVDTQGMTQEQRLQLHQVLGVTAKMENAEAK